MPPSSSRIIQAQKGKIVAIEGELHAIEMKLNALTESLKYERAKLDGMLAIDASNPASKNAAAQAGNDGNGLDNGKRRRPISAQWKPMFADIAERDGATVDDLASIASARAISRKMVTSQIRYYEKQGFIRSDKETGKYYITDHGRDVSGLKKKEGNDLLIQN